MKNIDKKWFVIAGLIIALLAREGCNQHLQNKLVEDISSYQDSAKHYQLKLGGGTDVEVASNAALVLKTEAQVRSLLAKNDSISRLLKQFKKVNTAVIATGSLSLKNDTIKLRDTIAGDFSPIPIEKKDSFFHFKGVVYSKYFIVNDITFPDKQTIVVGDKRVGFMHRQTTVDIMHSNKYMQVDKIEAYVVEDKKWWKSGWVKFGIGFIIGTASVIYLTH